MQCFWHNQIHRQRKKWGEKLWIIKLNKPHQGGLIENYSMFCAPSTAKGHIRAEQNIPLPKQASHSLFLRPSIVEDRRSLGENEDE